MFSILFQTNIANNVKVVQSNETILQVLDNITDASEENQYVIFLPPRIYYLEEPLVCKEWVHLICPAPYGAILKPVFEGSSHLIEFASNTYVHGIYMDAEYKTLGAQIYKNVHNVILRNCLFQKNADHVACSVDGGYDILFENCIARYSHGDDGFSVEEVWDDELGDYVYGHNVTYINCKSHDHSEASGTQHGFEVEDGCHDVTFINCEAWNCAGIGIHTHSGYKGCYNITLIGGKYSRFESSIGEPGEYLTNLKVFGTYIEPYWKKDVKFNVSIDPHLWYCGLRNLKNSDVDMTVNGLSVEISSCENSVINLKANNIERVNFSDCSSCFLEISASRWENRPDSVLSSDVQEGDTIIYVDSIDGFEIGQRLKLSDSNNSEYVIVKGVDVENNSLETTSPISNSYSVANGAKVEVPYWRILMTHGDGSNVVKVYSLNGYANYSDAGSNCKIVFISSEGVDVRDLLEDFTLYPYSKTKLLFNPQGADRKVVPITWSNCFYKGFEVTIKNTGDTYNLIFDPDGLNLTISPGESARVIYDGEQWRQI